MSAAVARQQQQQQQSGHGTASNAAASRMGTNSPVEKRVTVKAEGTSCI